jgi:quercetin 2,3-dioxygenase
VLFLSTVEGDSESEIKITAKDKLRVLLYAGEPINEPVVAYEPFVMNMQEVNRQAILDYHTGKFDE